MLGGKTEKKITVYEKNRWEMKCKLNLRLKTILFLLYFIRMKTKGDKFICVFTPTKPKDDPELEKR